MITLEVFSGAVKSVSLAAVHDRQLRGRLANRHDVAEDFADLSGAGNLRGTPYSGRVLFPVDY